MNVSVTNHGSETVAVVSGEIDSDNCAGLSSAVLTMSDLGPTIVFDMADVTFIDSSGLSELLRVKEKMSAENRSVRVQNPSVIVRRILEITGLLDALAVN